MSAGTGSECKAVLAAEGERLYYEFLGVKTVGDVEKLIGFDRKQVEAIRTELRESVAKSGVTRKARAIARWDSITGPYWRTFDFKETKGKTNPLKVRGADIEKFKDGSEGYFTLANYFWGTYAGDGKDNLVGAVPGDIATDHFAKGNFKEVMSNISCLRCHEPGGLQPIDGWTRNLLNPPLELLVKDSHLARQRRQQYLRKLEPFLKRDQERYIEAVKEATGWDAKTYRLKYVAFWEAYEDASINAAFAARRLSIGEKELREKVLTAVKTGYYDTHGRKAYPSDVVANFVHQGPRERAIDIRQFEDVIPELYQIIGYQK